MTHIPNDVLRDSIRRAVKTDGFALVHPCYEAQLATCIARSGLKITGKTDDGFTRVEQSAVQAEPEQSGGAA